MRALLIIIITVFVATSSFAAELSETDVKAFLADWLAAQNTGSYSTYAEMYSKDFSGIRRSGTTTRKLNHDAWLKDRKKMFNKKMLVQAINPEIRLAGQTASIKFEQIWESGTYKDKGQKLLELVTEEEKVKIVREELLVSNISTNLSADKSSVIDATDPQLAQSPTLTSKYTSLKAKDCKPIKSDNMILFFGNDTTTECQSLKGWRIFKENDGEGVRSWLRIAHHGSIWTTANVVWGDEKYEIGLFPNVDSSQVEWRVTQQGEPQALMFRVTAQKRENQSSLLSRLYVIQLRQNIPLFCGTAKTAEAAREIADKSSGCTTKLQKTIFPNKLW